ncbi:PREDICTED: N-acylneuraminate-9-phosphatase [Nicrophorus vespilloides]|uniref:N-acylneuraminate-9-phosphatase n=1 Tax=Nicrophorus vespilloides TaxID=110193 RepID=A0ABM1MPS6_NICVS|nr:PREDICTED: N-acylneuraminate-9-phosphatase [Nicrophorus vespilloides]
MDSKIANISVIFFDLDNTLITTRKADKLACNKLSEILWEKYEVQVETSIAICSKYLKAFRKCPDNPSVELHAWRRKLWMQALGDEYTAIAGEVYLKWLQLRYHYLALTPDVQMLLKKLRLHFRLGLITNGPSCAQWEKVERLNLKGYFDLIVVSGDLPWEKPQHEIFHEACRYLGVEPGECLMVGDKLETDILGGKQANLAGTVWIPLVTDSPERAADFHPDFIISKVTDLPGLLPQRTAPVFRQQKNVVFRLSRDQLLDDDDCSNNSC